MENYMYAIAYENGEYIHFTNSYSECILWLKADSGYAIGEWNEKQQCYLFSFLRK